MISAYGGVCNRDRSIDTTRDREFRWRAKRSGITFYGLSVKELVRRVDEIVHVPKKEGDSSENSEVLH